MLRALGWDHPRCMSPMRACAERWREIDRRRDRLGGAVAGGVRRPAARGGRRGLRPDRDRPPVLRARRRHPLPDAARRAARPLGAGRAARRRDRPEPRLVRLRRPPVGPGDRRGLPGGGGARRPARRTSRRRRRWDAVLELARRRPGAVALPLSPPARHLQLAQHLRGARRASRSPTRPSRRPRHRDAGRAGAARPARRRSGWEPPDVARPADDNRRDRLRPADLRLQHLRAPSAERPCRFADVPAVDGRPARRRARRGRAGGLGGVTRSPAEAAAFAAWASGAEAQHDIVARTGGQPGHRSAWDDPELDAARRRVLLGHAGVDRGGVGAARATSGGRRSSSTPGGCSPTTCSTETSGST